ncbi:MAG: nuclease-related domain-containing protein [Gammaproteobacteria bacterium]
MGFWKYLFTGFLADITGSPVLRGKQGESLVSGALARLPESEYAVYEDLLLPSKRGGLTQIDHAVFSRFGIFVVETKNYGGWIFAGKNDRVWTRVLRGGRKHKFQNPLRQNYKHMQVLRELTGLPPDVFYNIIVFAGDAEFKTPLPDGVITRPGNLDGFIAARQNTALSESQVNNAIAAVLGNTGQFIPEEKRRHIRNLREKYKK